MKMKDVGFLLVLSGSYDSEVSIFNINGYYALSILNIDKQSAEKLKDELNEPYNYIIR